MEDAQEGRRVLFAALVEDAEDFDERVLDEVEDALVAALKHRPQHRGCMRVQVEIPATAPERPDNNTVPATD